MEGVRTLRSHSREPDNLPKDRPRSSRRGQTPSIEQQMAQLNPAMVHQLAPIPEDGNGALYEQAQPLPPNPFTMAPTLQEAKRFPTQKRASGRKARNAQSNPAPTAPMSSIQAQDLAQRGINQTPLDPQLEDAQQQKRSMLDRQPGAERVPFGDDSQVLNIMSDNPLPILQGDVQTTQDNGFQPEAQTPAPPPKKTRAQKRNRTSDAEYVPPGSSQEDPNKPPSPPRGTPPPSNYAQVQQQAKLFTATLRKDKIPQKRKAWTLEECDCLIEGIGRFGNGYAALKGDDAKHRDILHDRSAEDLRHKARNMKFDYLKAGIQLPDGFDSVLLDKKFQTKLSAMGRPYHQEQQRRAKRLKEGQDAVASDDAEIAAQPEAEPEPQTQPESEQNAQ